MRNLDGVNEQACLVPTQVFNAVSLSLPTNIFAGLRLTVRNLIPQQQVGASANVCLCRCCGKPQTCSRCFSSSPRGSWDWLPPPVTQCRMSADGKWMLAQLKELHSPCNVWVSAMLDVQIYCLSAATVRQTAVSCFCYK